MCANFIADTVQRTLCVKQCELVISNLNSQSFYNILLLFYAKKAAINFLNGGPGRSQSSRCFHRSSCSQLAARTLLQLAIYVSAAIAGKLAECHPGTFSFRLPMWSGSTCTFPQTRLQSLGRSASAQSERATSC